MQCLQLLTILTVLISACAESIWEPGNNDSYVEGESRWVWIADAKGRPKLVDLFKHLKGDGKPLVDHSLIDYWLFTRRNPVIPDILRYKDKESVRRSHYRAELPLTFLAHGWRTDGNGNTFITAVFLGTMDTNVVVIDWRNASHLPYFMAARAVSSVGEHTGDFLNWLLDLTGTSVNKTHLVGHSLGAHLVGVAGRKMKELAARVTGLDPAGPLFKNNPDRLNTSSGVYVETINTDMRALGIQLPLGHVNFYPNGGRNQPGCWLNFCSHNRAYDLFAATICYNNKVGKRCKDLEEAERNACTGEDLPMGNCLLPKTGEGIYSLATGKQWPYYSGFRGDTKNSHGFHSFARPAGCRAGFRRHGP